MIDYPDCKHMPWGETHPNRNIDRCDGYCSEECKACEEAPHDTAPEDQCMDCYVGYK